MLIGGRQIEGIGLGTAQFAFRDGTREDSVATVHAALDGGVRLIDTALAYTRAGVESYAEQVLAYALRGGPTPSARIARSACAPSRWTGSISTSSTAWTLGCHCWTAWAHWINSAGKARSRPSDCRT